MPRRTGPLLLAIDIGTSSIRSGLFDEKARPLAKSGAAQGYSVRYSAGGAAELNPTVLLRAARACMRKSTRSIRRPHVISGSGFWHSLLGIDDAGKPLTPIYTWADTRAMEDAARLREQFDERDLQQRTGCMLRASFWPAKLLWLRRTQPKLFRAVRRWLSPAEWVFLQLFNISGCSPSMASATGLYNLATRDWDPELLHFCRLTTKQLPPLVDRVERADQVVFPAIGDGAASNLGSGASEPGCVAINVGTSGAVRTIAPPRAVLPIGLFRFVIDQRRQLLGGAISNAGNLRAWCLRELNLPPNDAGIEKLLRRSSPATCRLAILPFWVEERAPSWPEHLAGLICGLNQATTAADLLRAATQAACDRLAAIFDLVESASGRAQRIIVSGGILKSPASLKILADAVGRDLEICRYREASLRGAAIHGLEQTGLTIPTTGPRNVIVRHNPRHFAAIRERQARQRELEESLGSSPAIRDRAP